MNKNIYCENLFTNDESDYYTYMEYGKKNKTICCINNINLLERIYYWKCCLPETFNRGCAINSLVFMGEMSFKRGCIEGLKVVNEQPNGTPFQHIIDWFNIKINKSDINKCYKEIVLPIFNNDTIEKMLFNFSQLPPDSCTIVKLNRNETNSKKYNLSIGHTIIFGNDLNNNLWVIDPQKMKLIKCINDLDKNILINEFKTQMYEKYSIVNILEDN